LRHGAEIVEADRARDRHPIVRADLNLGLDPADRTRDQSDYDASKLRQRLVTREHQDRAATFVFKLEPDNFAGVLPRLLTDCLARVRKRPGILRSWRILHLRPMLEGLTLTNQPCQRGLNLRLVELVHEAMQLLARSHRSTVAAATVIGATLTLAARATELRARLLFGRSLYSGAVARASASWRIVNTTSPWSLDVAIGSRPRVGRLRDRSLGSILDENRVETQR